MNTLLKNEIQTIQCDLVMLEGMIDVLTESAYAGINPVLIGNSLEIMKEFLKDREERLEEAVLPGWTDKRS